MPPAWIKTSTDMAKTAHGDRTAMMVIQTCKKAALQMESNGYPAILSHGNQAALVTQACRLLIATMVLPTAQG